MKPLRLVPFFLFVVAGFADAQIQVDIDFPGGSGEVVQIDEEKKWIVLNPSRYPDRGFHCWWYVRLTGLPVGETWTIDVGEAPWATPDQATVSRDSGKTWQHTKKGKREGKRIRYALPFDQDSLWISWGPPFVPSDGKKLVERLASQLPEAEAFSLCTTREGRETPAMRVGKGSDKPLVWIQARQHAWESGSSWVGKGFAEWLVSKEEMAKQFREQVEVVFVPIMDVDNVHRGAGGKSQKPRDHNRDWTDEPHWKAVAAAQKEIRAAAESGRLAAFIDLHNPGASSRFPYFYVPPRELLTTVGKQNQDIFMKWVKAEMTGPLRFAGSTIESGPKYDPKAWKAISKNWVVGLESDAISVTLETAWNTSASTTEGYEAVGRQLGKALAGFYKETE